MSGARPVDVHMQKWRQGRGGGASPGKREHPRPPLGRCRRCRYRYRDRCLYLPLPISLKLLSLLPVKRGNERESSREGELAASTSAPGPSLPPMTTLDRRPWHSSFLTPFSSKGGWTDERRLDTSEARASATSECRPLCHARRAGPALRPVACLNPPNPLPGRHLPLYRGRRHWRPPPLGRRSVAGSG